MSDTPIDNSPVSLRESIDKTFNSLTSAFSLAEASYEDGVKIDVFTIKADDVPKAKQQLLDDVHAYIERLVETAKPGKGHSCTFMPHIQCAGCAVAEYEQAIKTLLKGGDV